MPNMPAVFQRSWISLLFVCGYIVALMMTMSALTKFTGPEYPFLPLAPVVFGLIHLIGPRIFIPNHFRRGCLAYARGDLDAAIRDMQACNEYFEAHTWIDRLRIPILFNASAISIREMALYNIVVFQTLQHRREEAKLGVQKLLTEFPNSVLGRQMMTAIETFESPSTT